MDSVSPSDNASDMEKQEAQAIRTATPTVTILETSPKKPFSFYMAFLSIALLGLIISWDATSLAIALPVRFFQP